MTWAQVVNGQVTNTCEVDPVSCFTKEWLDNHPPFVVVPAGTLNGAVINAQGGFDNPLPKLLTPKTISATEFQDICETGLGGNAIGRAAFGTLIRTMSASADDEVLSVFKRYEKSITFDKAKVATLFQLLKSKGLLSQKQINDILLLWPDIL